MRHAIVVICAVTCGASCEATAAEVGVASFYAHPRADGLVAAHRSLPIGSQVLVRNLKNGRRAVVTIVDRGPYVHGRVVDVSPAAAASLGFRSEGVAPVEVRPISPPPQAAPEQAPALVGICKYDAAYVTRVESGPADEPRFDKAIGCDRLTSFGLMQPVEGVASGAPDASPVTPDATSVSRDEDPVERVVDCSDSARERPLERPGRKPKDARVLGARRETDVVLADKSRSVAVRPASPRPLV